MSEEREIFFVSSLPADFADRLARLRSSITPDSKNLEIGGSYNPVAPRSAGFCTFTVDHASREELLAKYAGHFDAPQIEQVDFICHDGNLAAVIPTEHHGTFDVCIASHVIEHMTNPILFLQAVEKLLKPSGVFVMAVPDKRGCFDFFRPVTRIGSWLLAHARNASIHTALARFEFAAYTVAHEGAIIWPQGTAMQSFSFASYDGLQHGYSVMREIGDATSGEYYDVHSWVFVPASFSLIIYELHALGMTSFVPFEIHTEGGPEFFVDLRKESGPRISDADRMRLLKRAAKEEAESFNRLSE